VAAPHDLDVSVDTKVQAIDRFVRIRLVGLTIVQRNPESRISINSTAILVEGQTRNTNEMKKFLLGTISLFAVGMAGSASAADLPARTYSNTKAPLVVAAVYDWSGFYVGADGGWGGSSKCWSITNVLGTPVAPAVGEGCSDGNGGVAGGQIGYRWQTAAWVFGVEA
jgi:hypothetical protein